MDYVKEVVENELKQAERRLENYKFEKEHIQLDLKRVESSIKATEKHIEEMREYLNHKPVAHKLVCQVSIDGKDIGKGIAKELERQVNLSHFFKGPQV